MAIEWTEEQEDILAHRQDESARIIAGPGTGKSATMVEWVGRILDQDQPPRVRLLTFTRAATAELAEKVAEHQATASLRPSTVHSFAISVLLQNPGVAEFPEPLRIADDWERNRILHRTLGRRIGVRSDRIGKLFTELAANWEALEERQNPRIDPQERARFLAGWQEHRQIFGYTHLGELPWALRRALLNHPDLSGSDHDLLVVDEYQDLNACDLEVLRLLSDRGICVIGVGDDDQSIYSFRRAAPEGIRRFPQDYANAADYPLSITHRCGATIMDWASDVIARDLGRDVEKPMPTPSEGSPDGEVALLAFAGHTSEPEGIAEIVDHLINREEIDPPKILILLRSDYNEQFSRPIKAALEARGIVYADPNEVTNELAEAENRTILSCFRLLWNRSDSLAWATLANLTPGIGDGFVDWVYEQARDGGVQFGEKLLEAFEDGFAEGPSTSRARAQTMVETILGWIDGHQIPDQNPELGWGQWIIDLAGTEPIPAPTEKFAEILAGVDAVVDSENDFGRYLGQITPIARDQAQAHSDGVRIMSMASSKGLTVDATIVAGAEEGIVPSRQAGADSNEECRLLYVAMTRAKRFLFCTWARRRTGPTAWAGRARVAARRNHSSFFEGGPIQSQDGRTYIRRRWPDS